MNDTPTPDAPAPYRDWPEDASHENGNYQNKCPECGEVFIGHKRRVWCRICSGNKPASQSERPAPPTQAEPWVEAARKIARSLGFFAPVGEGYIRECAEQHAATVTKERDEARYDLEQAKSVIVQWQESWKRDTTRLTAERDSWNASFHAANKERLVLRELVDDAIPNMEQRDGGPFALAWVKDARAALSGKGFVASAFVDEVDAAVVAKLIEERDILRATLQSARVFVASQTLGQTATHRADQLLKRIDGALAAQPDAKT